MGKEIYKQTILPQVEANHFGEYVAIDVETGTGPLPTPPARPWNACERGAPILSTFCVSASDTGPCAALGQGRYGRQGDRRGSECRL